jgi:group I intron endonuclease
LARTNLYVVRALSKHGLSNFSLVILEYTSSEDLIACEQKWIDLLKPEYNTNPTAGSSKGYIHTAESIEKMCIAGLGRKHTEGVRLAMSESRKGKNNAFFGKTHSDQSLALIKAAANNRIKSAVPGLEVEITDLETKLTTTYESIRKAAVAIGSDIKSISRREKSQLEKGINTPYRNRYMIVIRRS